MSAGLAAMDAPSPSARPSLCVVWCTRCILFGNGYSVWILWLLFSPSHCLYALRLSYRLRSLTSLAYSSRWCDMASMYLYRALAAL